MLDKKLFDELQEFIDFHLNVPEMSHMIFSDSLEKCSQEVWLDELDDFIKNNHKPTLTQLLFTYIDQKGVSDPEIYKKAGMDRKHFSKLRSNPNYQPKKNTVIALALALELNSEETDDFLDSAGYSLSQSDTSDLVIQFCIEKKIFKIEEVNQALYYFSLKPLGI
ncbi:MULTISPECIES: hypothetical protein [unclassified Bacillus (in: firmicutes)]|uniref:hypothetical protein n=1 Tax=unclassified Bacillus (in: firmicutes) TaxID=185979 RepID=UPI0008F246F5|nr:MULTISPECIES: hypothetical protein [unclassified Bacillus (in: firmicutes)]SFB09522.1 hypothetical protein SAMN02799634_105264 [Bacillus sp. UNCCL13]SFQ86674.1 hypothetical protein SAMN04488577_2856 [Bacillus sp. cl95]